ncbi:MAG: serine/threonine-protein kinase [Planctomycetota bacterium]|nr:serine/threonine-protein kinase [Planctomycetota bacterium]
MKEDPTGRSTRLALPSATSTWRSVAKHGRQPVKIAVGHLEKEQSLNNALDEYCQLREQDKSLTASQFCDRYPSYRQSLFRLIDVQDQLEHQPPVEDENWPELFSEFLGYQIMHELGVGAIARVYLAAETALGGRLVALKVSRQGGEEAETLGKLTHPNVVPVFSVKHEEESGMTAVCMPYHGSATLTDLLEIGFEEGKPPTTARVILEAAREREQVVDFVERSTTGSNIDPVLLRGSYVDGVVRLAIQIAEALAYTHERGILHRDLKPSNVLLTPLGVAMLLDFNLASDIEMGGRRVGGTLLYMPPEQIRDVHVQPFEADLADDPRSDIFSLGVILYELLTGQLPFGDPSAGLTPRQAAEEYLTAQQQVPRPVQDLNPAVSPEFAQLIHKCLALEPNERPVSATDFVSELKKYFSTRRRTQRWTSRHRGLVATIVLLLMSTATASTWYLVTRPTYAVRQYLAGVADIGRGQYDGAIEHLDQAIRIRDDSVPCHFTSREALPISDLVIISKQKTIFPELRSQTVIR